MGVTYSVVVPHHCLDSSAAGNQDVWFGDIANQRETVHGSSANSGDYSLGEDLALKPAFEAQALGLGHSHDASPVSPTTAVAVHESTAFPDTPEIPPPAATAVVDMSPMLSSAVSSIPMSSSTAVADASAASWATADHDMELFARYSFGWVLSNRHVTVSPVYMQASL